MDETAADEKFSRPKSAMKTTNKPQLVINLGTCPRRSEEDDVGLWQVEATELPLAGTDLSKAQMRNSADMQFPISRGRANESRR